MENNQKMSQNTNSDEMKISKKSLYIGIGIVFLLLSFVGGYFIFSPSKKAEPTTENKDSLSQKKDSIAVKKDSLNDGVEENTYTEYRIIANNLKLPNGRELKYGDIVYVHYLDDDKEDKSVYLDHPFINKSTSKFIIKNELLVSSYHFDEYKTKLSLPPYLYLPPYMKKAILEEDGRSYNGHSYTVTQNKDRANNTLSIGDYDSDGEKDIAVVLDNNELQESRLIILATNKASKTAYLAYTHSYITKVKVRSLAKGANIYMDTPNLVKSPREGVILDGDGYQKIAIIYDAKAQLFKAYEQAPLVQEDNPHTEAISEEE